MTEEDVVFSLFDEDLPIRDRTEMAEAIYNSCSSSPRTFLETKKPTLPEFNENSKLVEFIGPRSRLLFDLLNLPLDFLSEANWHLTSHYQKAKAALKSLSATNDSAERAIALMTQYETKITQDEESFQDLLQVVEYHRIKQQHKD